MAKVANHVGTNDHQTMLIYWKSECESWQTRYESLRVELDEFTSSSRELEHELEQELSQYKQHNDQLKADAQTLMEENRSLKECEQRTSKQLVLLEDQIKERDNQKQKFLQYRRELEQKNDDMETSHRNLTASLADYGRRVEELMEVKALLENELEHKRSQKEIEQRLRDELKELRDELSVERKSKEMSRLDRSHSATRVSRNDCSEAAFDRNPDCEIMRLQALALGHFDIWQPKPASRDPFSNDEYPGNTVSGSTGGLIVHIIKKISILESKLSNKSQNLQLEAP